MFFLERAEDVLRVVPQAKFLWVGEGALSGAWDKWVAARGLGRAIQRLPWRNDVPLLMLAADVFLHVTEAEGLPLATLEAMSAALPCVITPGMRDELPSLDDSNSIMIGEDGAWLKAFRDPERLRTLGAAARQVAEEKFSCAQMAASYEALYHETLAAA
jgi:glycosyltransferase involved in cell wall biosynthesis